jgi:hypothetical protein
VGIWGAAIAGEVSVKSAIAGVERPRIVARAMALMFMINPFKP